MPVLPAYERRLQQGNPFPYYSTDQSRQNSLGALVTGLSLDTDYTPTVKPAYDYASQANAINQQADKLRQESAQNAIYNNTPIYKTTQIDVPLTQQISQQTSPTKTANPTGRLGALLRALGAQESGGNYSAVNSSSGALGKYQVMPSNVAAWSKQALGHSISTSQFLHSPKLQDQIVRTIFGDYYRKYGAKGALSAWYSGSPTRYQDKSSVSGGPSVYDYVQEVLDRM